MLANVAHQHLNEIFSQFNPTLDPGDEVKCSVCQKLPLSLYLCNCLSGIWGCQVPSGNAQCKA